MRRIRISLSYLPLILFATTAAAEPVPVRAERLPAPGRNPASEDSGYALVLNPANLSFMPSWEGRAQMVKCPDDAVKAGCGWALDFSTPLFWNIATGIRFDWVQPSWNGAGGVPSLFRHDYGWLTWGLSYAASERFAFGMTLQRSFSDEAALNKLLGITAGLSYRPSSHFAFGLVASDFNGPSYERFGANSWPVLDRSYSGSVAFRPTGRRAVELGLDVRYLDGSNTWLPRVVGQIDIPGLGRARADIEVSNPGDARRSVSGSAGLEINLGNTSVSGGILAGPGLGSSDTMAGYGQLSVSGVRHPGVRTGKHAVVLRIEKTPGTRSHVALLRRLWKLAEDPEIAAVSFVLRTEPAGSLAHAEELADAIRVLKAFGKKTLCSLEDNGAVSLYVCANADRIVVNPAGGVRYAGLKSQHMYFAGLLKKIGVKAEFVRVSEHKSAPEQFMNEHSSAVAMSDHLDLLHNREAVFDKNLAVGRKLSITQVREATRKGPFIAEEARAAGFVDGFAFDDEIERITKELVGSNVPVVKLGPDPRAPDTFGVRGKVAVLYIDGDIIDGRSRKIPILGTKLVGSYTIADVVRQLQSDATIKSVVVRIESPGGSSMASDVMWRELMKLNEKKPVIVSMGSVAASGGYYVAAPATKIFALPLSITGSIGVFYGKADLSELLKRIGVNVETHRTAPRADAESLFRGFTDEERVFLERKVGQFYNTFLDRVARGRKRTKEQIDAVGQGRVWTGQQAQKIGLVDELGGMREALAEARKLSHLPSDAPIEEYPEESSSLIEKVLKFAGVDITAQMISLNALPPQLRETVRAIAPMAIYSGDTALARAEWIDLSETPGDDTSP